MRKLKLVLLTVFGVILVSIILAAVLMFVMKESILARALEHVTGQRVVIEGRLSFGLSMEPTLSVSGIRIGPAEGKADPFSADIGHIRTKIALEPLLSGAVLIRDLTVDDVTVFYVEKGGHQPEQDDERDLRDKLADIDIPIFESVTLQNINVSYLDEESDYSMQVLLHTFNIDDVRDRGPLYVKGTGSINKTAFSIDGQLGSITDALRQASPYPVHLGLSIADLAFRISGSIDHPFEGAGLNILVTADETELSNVLDILKIDTPGLGYLDLDAKVTGHIEAPRISGFTLNIFGEPDVEVSVKGTMENLLTGEGTDIAVSALTSNNDIIRLLLPEDLHVITELELAATLLNSEGEYLMQGVRIILKEGNAATIKADGTILFGATFFDPEYSKSDLRLYMEAKNTLLLRSFLFDWLPDTGPVTGQARLVGSLMDPDLKDINVTAGESERVWINVQGRVASIPHAPELPVSGIDMSLSIKADEALQLFANLGIKMPELDDVSAQAHLHGSGERLIFDDITIQMTDPEGVAADVSGTTIMEKQDSGEFLETFDLDVNMSAPTVASFQRLLAARALPDLGPVKLTFNLKGTNEVISIDNLLLQAGHRGPVRLEWRGRVSNIIVGDDKLLPDVQIQSNLSVEKTSLLSPYAGISLPDLGPLRGSSNIVSRKGGYGVDDLKVLIGDKENPLLKAAGRVGYVMRGTDVAFEGIDLTVDIPGIDSRIIAEHIDEKRMDIGKASGGFSLSGSPDDFAIGGAKLQSITHDGLEISFQGGMRHIRLKDDMPVDGIEMELTANSPDMNIMKRYTDLEFPDLGAFRMSASVRDYESELNVERFKIRTGLEADATLLIEGSMDDILNRDLINFSVIFEAATRPWLEEFYGHSVPEDHRVKGNAALTGSRDKFYIEGTAQSGKTHVNAHVEASRVNGRRSIAAHISAPKIYLDDLGIYPEVREKKAPAKKDKKSRRQKIFSDEPWPFPELKEMDLSFSLDTDEVIGRGFFLNDFDIDVVLRDGLMQIGPLRTTYAQGFVSLESTLDMRGSRPEMKLNLKAEDIDTADLFSYAHSPMILGGNLNLAIDFQSSGHSPREVASALNGDLGIAIEHGQIKQIADLLGADAIDLVASTRKRGAYQKLDCLAVNFTFEDGIGNSQVIYIDTPSVRSRGTGTVDLKEETIDLVIQPRPKKGQLGGSSAVTLKGPLNNPSAKKLPFIESARLFGEIFMPYAFLPARAAGYVRYLMKEDRDEDSPCLRPESVSEEQAGLTRDEPAKVPSKSVSTSSGVANVSTGIYSEPFEFISWKWQQSIYNNDTRIVPSNPEQYTLKLLPDGRVFIHADCNVAIGTYDLDESQISMEVTRSTTAVCPEGSLHDEFIRDLMGAAIYFIEEENLYLDLKYDTGTMKFSK